MKKWICKLFNIIIRDSRSVEENESWIKTVSRIENNVLDCWYYLETEMSS